MEEYEARVKGSGIEPPKATASPDGPTAVEVSRIAADPSPARSLSFLVLQHIACESPAAYEEELVHRGFSLERVELDEGDSVPDWREFDGVIVMGGPMGVKDEAEHPWLREEKALIADAVRASKPYWGVCLGAQLLAAALGARVYRGAVPEVGVYDDVVLTPAARRNPVFGAAPQRLVSLQWHSDAFDLPDGARLLATSPACQHQAFVWDRAYGLQFHLEVPAELASQWAELPAYAASLEQVRGPGAMPGVVDQIERHSATMAAVARQLFARWLDVVAAADRSSEPRPLSVGEASHAKDPP